MTAVLPDPQADPTGAVWLYVGAAEQDRADAGHIAAEANPAHALAEVALWRVIAARHVLATDDVNDPWCRMCVAPEYPCADLRAVVAACRAYAGGR